MVVMNTLFCYFASLSSSIFLVLDNRSIVEVRMDIYRYIISVVILYILSNVLEIT
jgi:hypothetical protein